MYETGETNDGIPLRELSYRTIGAMIEVHKGLGPGLFERVYHEAACIEFEERGIPFESAVKVPVTYKGREFEYAYEADIVVNELLVLEFKTVERLSAAHSAQCLTYMRALDCPVGYVINFWASKIMNEGCRRLVLSNALRG